MSARVVALGLLLALLPITGAAQSADEDDGGWVVTGLLGAAETRDTMLRVRQPDRETDLAFHRVDLRGRSFEPPLYYSVRGGYFFDDAPWLGLEAELIHLKVYAEPTQIVGVEGRHHGVPAAGEQPLGTVVQRYSVSHGVNLVLVNGVARYGFGRGPARPDGLLIVAGRIGFGPTVPHTESTIDGVSREQYELGRAAFQIAAGAELHVWRGLYGVAEYKFTRTRQRGEIPNGTAEALLRTHHGLFGLSYHF